MIKNISAIGLLAVLLAFLSACGKTVDQASKPYSKNNLTIVFRNLAMLGEQNEEYQGQLDQYQIDQPVEIDSKQIENHLLSLWYQRIESTEPAPPRPVFHKDEIGKIAPLFRAALNKVDSGDYIQFEYLSRDGVIEGELFSTVDRLHWRFQAIHGIPFRAKFLGMNQRTWRLVRITRAQRLHVIKTGLMPLEQEDWMVVDLKIPTLKRNWKPPAKQEAASSRSTAPVVQPVTPSDGETVVKEKLQKLKELLDAGLIDEADYNQKKQEILREHF